MKQVIQALTASNFIATLLCEVKGLLVRMDVSPQERKLIKVKKKFCDK